MSLKKSNVKELLAQITADFKQAGISTPSLDASLILMRWLKFTRPQLYSRDDYIPDDNQMRKIDYWVQKRLQGCPMAYLLEKADFMGLSVKVQESTLIPRPETELLVEEILSIAPEKNYKTGLDIGTGSGSIAIALSHFDKSLRMTACDISERALMIAEQNVKDHRANVTLIKSDLFESIEGKFDFIVSNPPYIKSEVIPTLERDVKDYEPLSALDGGADGLTFYRRIIKKASAYLNNGGMLAFEIGCDQGYAVKSLMEEAGFREITVKKDLSGLDRMVFGYIQVY